MRTTNVNPKRGYGLLIFLLALLLQTNTLSAQDSCSTYSYYFNYPGKRVFSDTTLWHDWYRSVEYEVNDFPEEGYFHVQAYILYNSENRQQNESLYLLVKNSTIRYPQNPNAQSQTDSAAYFVVPDDPTAHFDEFRIRNAGTFYFEKGHNVIQFNHYKKIVEQFPQFVNYYPGHDSLSPGVNSGKLLGGIRSGESVDCYMIALIPVNCSQDLQLQTEPRFSTNCLDSTGTLQMNFHINELTQQQFTTESIDSLVFKISSDSTVSFTGESPGWQSHIETKDQTVWTFVWHPQSNDVPLTELAEMLQLKVDMANFKTPVEAQITSQLFLKQDINPDNQYIKNTVPLQLDCSTPAVDLSVTKNGIWQSFLNSETIDYQIIVKNESTTPVANFIVRDSLDSRLQPVNFSLEPDIMGNTLVWQISETINPNETYSLVYSAQLPDSLHLSTSIILPNYVFVDTPNDANPNNNSDSTRHVYKTLDLSLEQFANVDTFCINDTINFTYLIHNNSPSTAYRIALQTQVPKALHLFERNEWNTIDSTADFYILKTNIDSLPGFNSFTATIKGIVLDSLTSTLRNPALVEVRNDSLLVNNAGQVALSAGSCSIPNEHVPFADLLIIKSISQDTAKTGDFFTYYIIATNLGPDSVSDFYLLEKMPAGIRIENMQTAHNISVSSDTIRWPGVSLAAGDSLQLHISAQMMTPANSTFQIFTNSISIISDADTLTANNADSASIVLRPVALVPPQHLDMTIAKSVDQDSVRSGDLITYTIKTTNLGPDTTVGFYLLEQLPTGLTIQSVQSNQQNMSVSGDTIRWPGLSLAAGEFVQAELTARVDAPGGALFEVFTNYVEVFSDADTSQSNNRDSAEVILRPFAISPPQHLDMTIAKSVDQDSVRSGDLITYTIKTTNLGPDTTVGFYLLEQLPTGLTIQSVQSNQQNMSVSGDTIRWPGLSLAAGEFVQVELTARVDAPGGAQFEVFTNFVEVFSDADTSYSNNRDSAEVILRPFAISPPQHLDMTIAKSVDQDSVRSGDLITYTIKTTNLGPDTTAGFYLLEQLPTGLTIQSVQSNQQNMSVSGDTIRWPGLSLAAGEFVQVELTARVDAPGGAQFEVFTNFVEVFSDADTSYSNNRDSAEVVLRPVPTETDLSLVKRTLTPVLTTGELAEFELIVTNNGPGYSDAFYVTDSLSTHLTFYDFVGQPETSSSRLARWFIPDPMTPGQSLKIQYSALVGENIPQLPDSIYNFAFLTTNGSDSNPANNRRSTSVYVTCNTDCYLDKNVFAPAVDSDLEIHFQPCRTERTPIKIYDMLGTYITTVRDEIFSAGVPQTVFWNGYDNAGQRVGSGAYIIVIGVAPKPCKLKFLLVQ